MCFFKRAFPELFGDFVNFLSLFRKRPPLFREAVSSPVVERTNHLQPCAKKLSMDYTKKNKMGMHPIDYIVFIST